MNVAENVIKMPIAIHLSQFNADVFLKPKSAKVVFKFFETVREYSVTGTIPKITIWTTVENTTSISVSFKVVPNEKPIRTISVIMIMAR